MCHNLLCIELDQAVQHIVRLTILGSQLVGACLGSFRLFSFNLGLSQLVLEYLSLTLHLQVLDCPGVVC